MLEVEPYLVQLITTSTTLAKMRIPTTIAEGLQIANSIIEGILPQYMTN